jgi:hypothetical protein
MVPLRVLYPDFSDSLTAIPNTEYKEANRILTSQLLKLYPNIGLIRGSLEH